MSHKLLDRQKHKYLSELSAAETKKLEAFLEAVEVAYQGFENDRVLMERSLEISSGELMQKNETLEAETKNQAQILENLQSAISELLPNQPALTQHTQHSEIATLVKFLHKLVTKQKQNQEAIREQEEQLRAILYSIGEGVVVIDDEENIILFNHTACSLTGFTQVDALGAKYDQVFQTENFSAEPVDVIKGVLKGFSAKHQGKDLFLQTKDTTKRPIAHTASSIKDQEENIIGCVVVFRDVTKEKEIDRMKTEFVSIASHQLRTPLTAIKWVIELMEDDTSNFDDEQKEGLQKIRISCERMIELVNDLLDVSRMETGRKFAIEKSEASIYKCLKRSIEEVQPMADKKQITLDVDPSCKTDACPPIDAEKISQVFHNFMSNAVKYSPEGSTVSVTADQQADRIAFSISDQGMGIPKNEQGHIFERFYRASNSQKSKSQGTGLGLYIARRIVEGHGGEVGFESQTSTGSTFYFSIPL